MNSGRSQQRDLVLVFVQLICMALISMISWANYSTAEKLKSIVRDFQTKQLIGFGADFVSLTRSPEMTKEMQ